MSNVNESEGRIVINNLLVSSGWSMIGDSKNVLVEYRLVKEDGSSGSADYVLLDNKGKPLVVIEAKSPDKDPLIAKEQAREYSKAIKARYIILTNSLKHYLWDTNGGNPEEISTLPSKDQLEGFEVHNPNIDLIINKNVDTNFIVDTQRPNFSSDPEYKDESSRSEFIRKFNLVFLRHYQVDAIKSIQNAIKDGKERFLFEMATGTGKTKTTAGVIKLFLSTDNAKRVLFLVDRIELEEQALNAFNQSLKPDYKAVIWKEKKNNWRDADIVISTVQSFTVKNRYKRIFNSTDFDLVISDESHRSIGGNARNVFEYFYGYKLGLTATPKDYLKSVDKINLMSKDPRELERRELMDTYTTFGCESGEPTFRYSLVDGVKDGYLINPIIIDARTEITTKLLSDEGYFISDVDSEGNEVEEAFGSRDFEKKFFSKKTNEIFCKTFLENAMKDPLSGEIGKSLIFCVSQRHASKITNILNVLASKLYPGVYDSDFAVQITSSIPKAQQYTINFTNNNLNGQSKFSEYYKSSKTRICVTCSMMTTGYDCEDVINIALMKPVFSPSDFIQMKGRGTRKHNFLNNWIDKNNQPYLSEPDKVNFKFFDFFGNCEYFEEKFDYDQKLKLPSASERKNDGDTPPMDFDEYVNINPDPLKTLKEIKVGEAGMRIDREAFEKFKEISKSDDIIEKLSAENNWEEMEKYLNEKVFDKPTEFFNLDKLRNILGVDRKISVKELIEYSQGKITGIKSKEQIIEDEYEKFDNEYVPEEENYSDIKDLFKSYLSDPELQDILETKQYAKLNMHPAGETFKRTPEKFRQIIPDYIKKNKLTSLLS